VIDTPLDRWLLRACLWIPLAALILFFGVPMLTIAWRSLLDEGGGVGVSNWVALWDTPGVWRALAHSLVLGVSATAITVLLAFVVAFGLERTAMPGKRFVGASLALPVLAPSLVLGLGLIFLLGRNGLVGKLLGVRPEVYGFSGLLIADVMYALPQAAMILRAALRHGDARHYEAAELLGATPWRRFVDITLPGMRYALLSAAFVVFTVTITDFGNAVVIGGDYPVLATEIYNQVSGQMKFGLGAVVGLLLLLPAGLSVWIEHVAARRQAGLGAESARPPRPLPWARRDVPFFVGNLLVAGALACVVGTVVLGSLMRLWPYKLEFTLKHYDITLAGGYAPLWTSLAVSVLAAVLGTLLLLGLALAARRLPPAPARAVALLSALPVAVPGLVLGLSYVFAFNRPQWPFAALYGSVLLLALCNFYHYHTQAYVTMSSGVRAVPDALEEACSALGGGVWRHWRDVYVPALRPTLWTVALFLFMRSMVTLSAVIFLITPSTMLGAVSVMRLDEAGFTSQAAAFSTCIMLIVGISAWLLQAVTRSRRP
jgi:iron(III) transport system permease protein